MQSNCKVPIQMPDEFFEKVKYLCTNISRKEWSGILFYEVIGSIKNLNDMKIILKDILPMDKGTSGTTAYDLDSRFTEYLMEKPERLHWRVGHIHSHNQMGVFFSATDKEELHENSKAHNFYLSLIVNNFMDFCAKIGTRMLAEAEAETIYKALDEDGKAYNLDKVTLSFQKEKLLVIDCEIKSKKEEVSVNEDFVKKVEEIIKKADTPIAQYPAQTQYPHQDFYQKKLSIPKTPHKDIIVSKYKDPFLNFSDFANEIPYNDLEEMEILREEDDDKLSDIEEFIVDLFGVAHFGEGMDIDSTLQDVFIQMQKDPEITETAIASSIIDTFTEVYGKHFEAHNKPEDFVLIVEEVVEILEEFEQSYPFISKLIMAVKYVLIKFEENECTV